MVPELICEVCGIEKAIGVACSLGPMSIAYCRVCAALRAEPLWVLEATDECCGGNMRPEYYHILTFVRGSYVEYREVC